MDGKQAASRHIVLLIPHLNHDPCHSWCLINVPDFQTTFLHPAPLMTLSVATAHFCQTLAT